MKVSVLIPLYNQEKYIEDCILSVINQTYEDIEIVIIDDGSTDKSYEIVEKYVSDKRIKLIRQDNCGLGVTRNRLVQASTSEFVFHLDSDDYITKDCIENMMIVQNDNNSDIIFSNFMVVNDEKTSLKKVDRKSFSTSDDYIKYFFSGLGYKSVCNTLIRKDIYTSNNVYVSEVNYGEDWSVIYKLIYFSRRVDNIQKYTYFYRKNNESMTHAKLTEVQITSNINDIIKIKNDYIEFIEQHKLGCVYTYEVNCYMIEVLNSIYSILLRNNKSIRWFNAKFKSEDIKIKISLLQIINRKSKLQIISRILIIAIKKFILLVRDLL